MEYTGISLPPPTDATRQVGVSVAGSPLLSRSDSSGSDVSFTGTPRQRSADDTIRERLIVFKENLEHEKEFVDSEIHALIARPPSVNEQEQRDLLQLRDNLKVRYNTICVKLTRVNALLEVV
jgi:hypothetical protein